MAYWQTEMYKTHGAEDLVRKQGNVKDDVDF